MLGIAARWELDLYLKENKISVADLLIAEKKRRGCSKNELTFLGIANIAKYYWCAQKSLFESMENEKEFFYAYLFDRIYEKFLSTATASIEDLQRWGSECKKFIKSLPKEKNKLLKVGSNIKFDYVNKKFLKDLADISTHDESYRKRYVDRFGKNKDGTYVIPKETYRDFQEESIEKERERTIERYEKGEIDTLPEIEEIKINPTDKGRFYHELLGKNYHSFRWNFEWDKYVFVGIPDGMTEDKVYEFKTTETKGLSFFQKYILQAQADLYGYFFKRDIKETDLYIINDNKTETKEEEVDKKNALETLKKFRTMESGETPILPKKWKCKICKYEKKCPIKQGFKET